jgi:signal transduction histidine kinase
MADKMQHDYQGLKEFTENASHEMQTPLALINAKVEQLIQSSQLTEHQSDWIDGIYQASRRMARLNQGLLLLAKIENGQFGDTHTVDLTAELMQRLTDMDEVIAHKQLTLSSDLREPFRVQLPPFLADSLVTNLISNAIRHNQAGGTIHVCSSAETLELSNTGPAPASDPATLFDRFKKGATNAESVGLGLAIVRQICHSYELGIDYQYQAGMHTLTLVAAYKETGGTGIG